MAVDGGEEDVMSALKRRLVTVRIAFFPIVIILVGSARGRPLRRAEHAALQRAGNRNRTFPAIVACPFFTRSELSIAVQLVCARSGTGERPATQDFVEEPRGRCVSARRTTSGNLLPAGCSKE